MKKTIFAFVLLLGIANLAYSQNGFTGTWVTTDFKNPSGSADTNVLDLKAEGTKLTGTISRPNDFYNITDGAVSGGNTITFKVTLPGAARVISYTGKLSNGDIAFTRSVKVRDEASNTGAGIYG